MQDEYFQPHAPGQLVPTVVLARRVTEAGYSAVLQKRGLAFVPDPLPPARLDRDGLLASLSSRLLAAQSALVRLDTAVAALPSPEFIIRPLGLGEVRASSQIEDTHATLEELAIADAAPVPSRDEVREVYNNLRALEHALASDLPICSRLLRDTHAVLMQGVRGDQRRPGEFRDVQVFIGNPTRGLEGATFVPPPPSMVADCVAQLERYVNRAGPDRFPVLVDMALVHYQFECIHPFSDGNGRLGRVLITIMGCKSGLVRHPVAHVSPYLERNRSEYYRHLLRVSTHAEWSAWCEFFLEAVAEQAIAGLRTAERLRLLRERAIRQIVAARSNTTTLKLIDLLFVAPAVTARLVSERLAVSVPAAQRAIDRLQGLGFVAEATGKGRGRVYVARPVLAAVEPGADDAGTSKDFTPR